MKTTMEDQIQFFETNYQIIQDLHILPNSPKIFIGDKKNRKCRYCNRSYPEVSFKKVAHAIPEFIGNKRCFAYDECDLCNGFFSIHVEDHFSNFLGVCKTITQINGKNGVPSYKTLQKKSRIDMTNHGLHITEKDGDEIVEVDDNNKRIKINAHLQPYIPVAVFKCLTKIGISILPENELINYQETLKWILEKDHRSNSFKYSPLIAYETFIPGNLRHNGIKLFLLRRKSDVYVVPYMIMVLVFANYFYQIYIPTMKKDKVIFGKKISIPFFPTPFDNNNKFGNPQRRSIDLSSSEYVRKNTYPIVMGFEKAIEHKNR